MRLARAARTPWRHRRDTLLLPLLLAAVVALLALPRAANCQGLVTGGGGGAALGSSGSYSTLAAVYGRTVAWKKAFAAAPRSACSSTAAASLCSAGAAGEEAARQAQLLVATSPRVWDSRSVFVNGKQLDLVGEAQDQRPCAACVGFAVASAARTAMAAALQKNAQDIEPLSVQDILYCSAGAPLSCGSGWRLADALRQLVERRIAPAACMPFQPPALSLAGGVADAGQRNLECSMCSGGGAGAARSYRPVERYHPEAQKGVFGYSALSEEHLVAQQVREWGAAVSRFDIMGDFKAFYEDPANAQKAYAPDPAKGGGKMLETHAVVIIGYNLEEGWWLCLNSWGPKWADRGAFRVKMGAASIATAPDLYGIAWRQEAPVSPPPLQRSPSRPECLQYVAKKGDYISRVATVMRLAIERLLLDNADAIKDLDAPLEGKELLLCNVKSLFDQAAERARKAAQRRTLGLSFGGGGYLMHYNLGVLDVFIRAGLVDRKTKMGGTGQNTQCLLCMGNDVLYGRYYLDKLRRLCMPDMCWGKMESVSTNMMIGSPGIAADAAQRCYGVCFIGLATAGTAAEAPRYFEVYDWRSVDDMKAGLLATTYAPVISSTKPSTKFRGQDVTTGWLARAAVPLCPPGTDFCVRVSPFAAPQVEIPFDYRLIQQIVQRVSSIENPTMTRPSLDMVFANKGDATAAAALAFKPAAPDLAASGARALELGVEIAPNVWTPLPVADQLMWAMSGGVPSTDSLFDFQYKLGQKDAAVFLSAVGLGDFDLSTPSPDISTYKP